MKNNTASTSYSATGLFLILILAVASACTPKIDNDRGGQSYAVGYALGSQLTKVKDDIDPKIVAMGLQDGIQGKSKLDDAKLQERLAGLHGKQRERENSEAEETLKKSRAYMETVAAKPGIQKVDDTVFYEVVKEGAGKKTPTDTDTITVSYIGKRTDGGTFDQANGATLAFKDLQLPGLKKAMAKMNEGDQWVVYLAPEAAFGMSMRPGVPLQSAVVYELTLTNVTAAASHSNKPAAKK